MKILFLCNYFQPMHYAENEISLQLKSTGNDVVILSGNKLFPFPNYSDTVEKSLGKRERKSGKENWAGIQVIRSKVYFEFAARALFFGIRKNFDHIKPDLIIVFGITTPSAIQAALFKPKKAHLILVDSHLPSELSQGNKYFKYFFYGLFRLFFSKLISERADKVIAVQEATKDIIETVYGIHRRIDIVSHGTNIQLFTFNSEQRTALRKKLSLQREDFVIIYTGKIIKAKGVDLLFKAFNILSQKYTNIYLLLVGDGPNSYKKVCLSSLEARFHSHVYWQGYQHQVKLPFYYSAADVAVWPLQESLSMIDAASCNLPFIVNDKCGAYERLSNNNALTYQQGSVSDLAKQIDFLYSHENKRKQMGKNGRALVEAQLSWEKKAKEYISIYE